MFSEGQRVRHKKHGLGTVRQAQMNDVVKLFSVVVLFDKSQKFISFLDTDQFGFNSIDELTAVEVTA